MLLWRLSTTTPTKQALTSYFTDEETEAQGVRELTESWDLNQLARLSLFLSITLGKQETLTVLELSQCP